MFRLKQTGIILAGVVAAGVMVLLGLWQLQVFEAQGAADAQARANEPPVSLTAVAPAGHDVGDAYGRTVFFTGRYDPSTQLLVPLGPGAEYRVLTAAVLSDGTAVPVVRGVTHGPNAPPPPVGDLAQQGILLPSEPGNNVSVREGQISSVRVALLAQTWPYRLTAGYVTLNPAGAARQGLEAATAPLPDSNGRLRNGAYAIQWWIFAAFAVVMSIKIARDLGRSYDLEDYEAELDEKEVTEEPD